MNTQVKFTDITGYFIERGWKYRVVRGNLLETGFSLENGKFELCVDYDPERARVLVYAKYPFTVPAEKRAEACEFVARMNFGLIYGRCELDPRDGDLLYACAMPTHDAPFYASQFKRMLDAALLTADQYLPGFQALFWGGKTVDEAIELVESQLPG